MGRTIHKRDVVNREVGAPVQPKQPRAVLAVLVKLVAVSLYGALGAGAIELEVGGVADHKHVPPGRACSIYDPFQVDRDALPVSESQPSPKTIVPRGDKDCRLVSFNPASNTDPGCFGKPWPPVLQSSHAACMAGPLSTVATATACDWHVEG